MNKFVFCRVQRGFWGHTLLSKQVTVMATDAESATSMIMQRSDYYKKLANGDTLTYILVDSNKTNN